MEISNERFYFCYGVGRLNNCMAVFNSIQNPIIANTAKGVIMTAQTAWALWILAGVFFHTALLYYAFNGHKIALIVVCFVIALNYGDYQYKRDGIMKGFFNGLLGTKEQPNE